MTMRNSIASIISAAVVTGCVSGINEPVVEGTGQMESGTYAVLVGMEESAFAGECPGAGIDCRRMTALMKSFTKNVKSFTSDEARKHTVVAAMKDAASKADLFVFYYSGHGGNEAFWNTKDEDDGKDEYLCLYDTYMKDDEIWDIVSSAKGRVFLIFDCCHSQTMYRNPRPLTLSSCVKFGATHAEDGAKSVLVWSGCPDNTYSYGDANGGKLTNTILKRYLHTSTTYDQLWIGIESDSTLKLYEEVQRTIIGPSFGDRAVFH